MDIIGAVVVGLIIFFVLIFAVIVGGAAAHKEGRQAAERTARDLSEGKGGDVTVQEGVQGFRGDPHVPV
jgi:hypothetical protein